MALVMPVLVFVTVVLPLSLAAVGQDFAMPTPENVRDGRYPLSRYLYIYINKAPPTAGAIDCGVP